MDKILVAEPIYSALRPEVYANRIKFWMQTFVAESAGTYRVNSVVMGPRRSIRSARDEAIKVALGLRATHLFFIDDDIILPDHILNILRLQDKPVVGGLIHRDDGAPIVFQKPAGSLKDYLTVDSGEMVWEDHPEKGVFECAAVGAGCMLIQTEVLHNLVETDRWAFNYDETERSMDVRFCRKARAAGFSVWCWPDNPCVQINHY